MQTREQIAQEMFSRGYNCAQSVFYAFCDAVSISRETALKTACGFGAGMARHGEVCGAVSGGILVLGARYGRGQNNGPEAKERTYAKVRQLMDRFGQKRGTCLCRELLGGCDLATEAGQKHFVENDLINKACRPCIKSVVAILEDIL